MIWIAVANHDVTAGDVLDNWFPILLGAALAGWSLWRLTVAFQRRTEPLRHPIAQRLAAYGDFTGQVQALDNGLAETQGGVQFLSARFVPGFLIQRSVFETTVLPTSGIVWIYKKMTKKSVNFIPVGTDYHVVIRGPQGEQLELKTFEAGADRAIAQIAELAPGAIVGYDARLEEKMRTVAGRREMEEVVRNRGKAVEELPVEAVSNR